jgi:hypothetical protein
MIQNGKRFSHWYMVDNDTADNTDASYIPWFDLQCFDLYNGVKMVRVNNYTSNSGYAFSPWLVLCGLTLRGDAAQQQ